MWILAVCQHRSELVLLINPAVQLIIGAFKLTSSIKYFPFHIKLFELLRLVNEQTGEFTPIVQYMLFPFESQGGQKYLNSKSKPSEDKIIPETAVSIKVAKKHEGTQEIKDRVVQETLEQLGLHLAANSRELFFPEMSVGIEICLRRFRKTCTNNVYRKSIQQLLEAIGANRDLITQKRSLLKQKQLSSEKLDTF
jgi:hypothetical protein